MSDTTMPEGDEQSEEFDPQAHVEQIANDARADFTLADMFGGPQRKLPEKKRLIFRDLDAMNAYQAALGESTRLRAILGEPPKRNAPADEKAAYKARLEEAEAAEQATEELRGEMLASAVSFHLRAYPNIALKRAKREARKIFLDPTTKDLREGVDQEEVQEWMDLYLFGDVLQKAVDSNGRVVEFGVPKGEIGEVLSNTMHPASWQLLMSDFRELTLIAGIGQSAIEDPGF